jgi:hypothetical protein
MNVMGGDERFLAREHRVLLSRFGKDSEQARAAEEVLRGCGHQISPEEAVRLLRILNSSAPNADLANPAPAR